MELSLTKSEINDIALLLDEYSQWNDDRASYFESGTDVREKMLREDADPRKQNLIQLLEAKSERQIAELVVLMLVGRGDEDASQWQQAVSKHLRTHGSKGGMVGYLLAKRLFSSYLWNGLKQLSRQRH